MAEGNGADLGSIYGLLPEVSKTVSRHDAMLERLTAQTGMLTTEVGRQGTELASHGSRLQSIEATMATKTELADLRQTVMDCHGSVLSQGILASELEGRVGRIEGHLGLPPLVHGWLPWTPS